jgi:hypothetical protein
MSQHRTSAAAAIALALTLGACADSPTTPQKAADEGMPTVSAATARGPAGVLLQDASSRLLPSLGEVTLRAELEHRLDMLATALESGDADRVRRQLTLTRKILERQSRAGDVADLASLSLALVQIDAQLTAPAAEAP